MAKLSLKQETIEAFASDVTQKAAMVHRRVSQKKNSILESIPLLNKMKEKVTAFDKKMTDRFGKNYTKTRNILIGVGKFYVAGQIGGPALVALGAINMARALKPMIKEAEEERKAGKVTGLIDFMKKNKKESAQTILVASLGAAVIGCGLAGAANGKLVARAGVAALVVVPEMKVLASTTKKWAHGDASFRDVARDMATVGISVGAFISGTQWGHHSGDHSGMEAGAGSVHADSPDIAVPISKADKQTTPPRTQPVNLQQALLNQTQPAAQYQKQPSAIKLAILNKVTQKGK